MPLNIASTDTGASGRSGDGVTLGGVVNIKLSRTLGTARRLTTAMDVMSPLDSVNVSVASVAAAKRTRSETADVVMPGGINIWLVSTLPSAFPAASTNTAL